MNYDLKSDLARDGWHLPAKLGFTLCPLAVLATLLFACKSSNLGTPLHLREYVFTANLGSSNVSSFWVNLDSGLLTGLFGSPFAAGAGADSIVVAMPKFLYVANFNDSTITGFDINPTSGALTPLTGSPYPAAGNPIAIASHISGRFVYTANLSSNDVSAFAVGSSGQLSPVVGSPFPAGLGPSALTDDGSGQYLFVTNGSSASISAFQIDSNSGALSLVSGSPVSTGAGTFPRAIVGVLGKYLYVALGTTSTGDSTALLGFSIGSGGTLTPIPGSPITAGRNPESVAAYAVQSSNFLFVANHDDNTISVFTINMSTGSLTPVSGSPFAGVSAPVGLTVDQTGLYLYAGSKNGLAAFVVHSNGYLTPVSGSPFATGAAPSSVATAIGPQ